MKDSVLKLKNNQDYYVLEELSHNNKKYALAAQCNLEKDEINEEELFLMEIKIIDDQLVVDEIYDDKVAEEVTMLFREKIQNSQD